MHVCPGTPSGRDSGVSARDDGSMLLCMSLGHSVWSGLVWLGRSTAMVPVHLDVIGLRSDRLSTPYGPMRNDHNSSFFSHCRL